MSKSSPAFAISAQREARERLLARQVALLQYLASRAAPRTDAASQVTDGPLQGFDAVRLDLVARLAAEKRIGKVQMLLPGTVHCLSHHAPSIIADFLTAVLPTRADRYSNAREFQSYVIARSIDLATMPKYVPDLCNCEFLIASCQHVSRHVSAAAGAPASVIGDECVEVRRRAEVRVYACTYDIRSLLSPSSSCPPVELPRRRAIVAVAYDGTVVRMFEIEPEVHRLLAEFDDWTPLEVPGAGDWLYSLCGTGLIEMRRCVSA
jgi:hypothetical protein